jgi:hypothetical protein
MRTFAAHQQWLRDHIRQSRPGLSHVARTAYNRAIEDHAEKILRRLRRALADLDHSAIGEADRLQVLHEAEYEISMRHIKDVPGGSQSPHGTFGEDRI